MVSRHVDRHPSYVEGCFGCRIATVSFAESAMPTRYPDALATTQRDRRWQRDIPAYRRLRRDGMQPKQIDGSADLETRASDQFEVEMGHIVPKFAKSRVQEGLSMVAEMDWRSQNA